MKKGQMKISFGMIFSILLIIAFLTFAFFGIKQFLDMSQKATYLNFQEKLKGDIEQVNLAESASRPEDYTLPRKVEGICFVDNPNGNLEVTFSDDVFPDRLTIPKIDLKKTLGTSSKLCFPTSENKIKLLLTKNYGEDFVTIERPN